MTAADRILSEFIDAWRAGARPAAGDFVDRAPPGERPELAGAIETFLAIAPEPGYDEEGWRALTTDPAVARIAAAVEADAAVARTAPAAEPVEADAAFARTAPAAEADASVTRTAPADAGEAWSALLPRLRAQRGLSPDGLAHALSERLGIAGREAKARAYLDDLEHDRLVPERLSRRLLDALAAVLGTPTAWLERASAGPAAPAAALYRRQGEETVEQRLEVIADAMLAGAGDWDEVDELFQGGR
jgi:hypothetical protein